MSSQEEQRIFAAAEEIMADREDEAIAATLSALYALGIYQHNLNTDTAVFTSMTVDKRVLEDKIYHFLGRPR